MRKKLFAGILILFASFLLAAQVKIDPGKIVIIPSKDTSAVTAAKELKTHLELISSVKIPLVPAGRKIPGGKTYKMYVGKVPANSPKNFALQESCFLITEKEAYFYGHEERGSHFAVLDFLEEALGVRWPSGKDIYAPKQNPIVVHKTKGRWIPPFTLRFMRSGKKQLTQRLWKSRMRMAWGKNWNYGTGDAELASWWKKYGTTHPEFFAMNIRGFRGPAPTRLKGLQLKWDADAYRGKNLRVAFCCTSDSYLDEVIAYWRKNPDRPWLNFSQPDVYSFECCYCEKCLALDPVKIKKGEKLPDYNLADRYIYMTNRFAEKAVKIDPKVNIMSEIYNFSRNPPSYAKIKYPDNVCYRMVPGDFTIKGIHSLIDGWKKAGMKRFFYRPNRHGHYVTLMPCGYEEYFFNILQKLVKEGCLGFDYDVAHTYLHQGQYFSDYVLFKAMQDPSKDFAYWENHYMQAFTPAQKEITSYFAYWRKEVWNKRLQKDVGYLEKVGKYYNFGRGLAWNLGKYYKEKDFEIAGKFLKKALQRKDLPNDVRRRIEELRMENDHNLLKYKAIAGKKDEYSIQLLRFREKHSLEILPRHENIWGDVCGLKKVQQLKDFLPPYIYTPVFWHFKLDEKDVGLQEKWFLSTASQFTRWGNVMATNGNWETPHKHYKNISAALRKKTAKYDGIAWYALVLPAIPENWKDRRVFLYFGAVDESCQVYINGKMMGERKYKKSSDWRTPFVIEITKGIDWKKKRQEAVIRVEDRTGAGGIWKRVLLVSKGK